MASENGAKLNNIIHVDDVVTLLNDKDGSKEIGVVIRSGNDSSESEDDSDCSDTVKLNEIEVCWYPSGREEIVGLEKVGLLCV